MQNMGLRGSLGNATGRAVPRPAARLSGAPSRRLRQTVSCSAGTTFPKFFVGGNWKCNGTVASVTQLCEDLNGGLLPQDVEVVCAPSSIHLGLAKSKLKSEKYKVAAQNCWELGNGAYTGEVSAEELVDFGITWVILGHSERRSLIHESNEMIASKVKHALDVGLSVIACIGESLTERNENRIFEVLESQLSVMVAQVPDWSKVVLAYEPVWAIGTGVVATPEQAQEVHAWLRKWAVAKLGKSQATTLRIIYGGSANDSNCNSLAVQPDIDGFLVGGASLKGSAFVKIVQSGEFKAVKRNAAAAAAAPAS